MANDIGLSIEYTGEILVKLKAASSPRSSPALLGDANRAAAGGGLGPARPVIDLGTVPVSPGNDLARWHRVSIAGGARMQLLSAVPPASEVWNSVHDLLRQPEIDWAEPEVKAVQYLPPEFSQDRELQLADDWHLGGPPGIRARDAWKLFDSTGRKPGEGVIIGHLDTGYTDHPAVPRERFVDAGVDFWDPTRPDATDPLDSGIALMPGHGTGTICLLSADAPGYQGVAIGSRVLPVRISPSVIHIKTSSMANGIVWAVHRGAEVITISMGGLPSQLWADAVNYAYENGVVICAAAGNNFALPLGIHTPSKVIFPARFNRVTAVAGITYKEMQYWTEKTFEMCGNYGPEVDVAAPTPDVLWAQPGGGYGPGAGTSSATPQTAGAAALWLSYHRERLAGMSPMEKVEACRGALLRSASRVGPFPYQPAGRDGEYVHNDYFGDGRIDAAAALEIAPLAGLRATPRDDVRDSLLNVVFKMLSGADQGNTDALADQIELLWTSHAVNLDAALHHALALSASPALRDRMQGTAGPPASVPFLGGAPKRS